MYRKVHLIGIALIGTVYVHSVVAQGDGPQRLGTFDDWGAYLYEGDQKLCFVMSRPTSLKSDPITAIRGNTYLMVSMRPHQQVWSEPTIRMDYRFSPGSETTAEIGTAIFALWTKGDSAWIKNPTEEARMIDAMHRGSVLVVKGRSTSGMRSADQYSLKGFSQAIERAAKECRQPSTTTTTTTPNRPSQPGEPACKRYPNLC